MDGRWEQAFGRLREAIADADLKPSVRLVIDERLAALDHERLEIQQMASILAGIDGQAARGELLELWLPDALLDIVRLIGG